MTTLPNCLSAKFPHEVIFSRQNFHIDFRKHTQDCFGDSLCLLKKRCTKVCISNGAYILPKLNITYRKIPLIRTLYVRSPPKYTPPQICDSINIPNISPSLYFLPSPHPKIRYPICNSISIPNISPSVYLLLSKYMSTWINFKVNNKETRTTSTAYLFLIFIVNFTYYGVFIVNFEHISHLAVVLLFIPILFLYKNWKIERYKEN